MKTVDSLRRICELITTSDFAKAGKEAALAFPTPSAQTARRAWPLALLVKIFVRDQFTDRYFGEPLVFPGTLRALSALVPAAFPYHPHWKQSLTHPTYWTHYPTIDHVFPVARGGVELDESNIVTTSMLRNAAKGNWLLSELGWPAERAPTVPNWDGLLPWFCREYERRHPLRSIRSLQQWYKAAKRAT